MAHDRFGRIDAFDQARRRAGGGVDVGRVDVVDVGRDEFDERVDVLGADLGAKEGLVKRWCGGRGRTASTPRSK